MIPTVFADVGAVIGFVQAVGWQVPGFTIADYLPQLRRLHDRMARNGPFTAYSHRFLLQGHAPE